MMRKIVMIALLPVLCIVSAGGGRKNIYASADETQSAYQAFAQNGEDIYAKSAWTGIKFSANSDGHYEDIVSNDYALALFLDNGKATVIRDGGDSNVFACVKTDDGFVSGSDEEEYAVKAVIDGSTMSVTIQGSTWIMENSTIDYAVSYAKSLTGTKDVAIPFAEASSAQNNEIDAPGSDAADVDTVNPYFTGMTSDGKYGYNIDGAEISIATDISKYIDGNIFLYTDLAYDLGWHALSEEYKENPNVVRFFLGEGPAHEVGFRDSGEVYDIIVYTVTDNLYTMSVFFDRIDLTNDSIRTYYCNVGGRKTVNMAEIIIITYLFENQTVSGIDVFEGVFSMKDNVTYHISQ